MFCALSLCNWTGVHAFIWLPFSTNPKAVLVWSQLQDLPIPFGPHEMACNPSPSLEPPVTSSSRMTKEYCCPITSSSWLIVPKPTHFHIQDDNSGFVFRGWNSSSYHVFRSVNEEIQMGLLAWNFRLWRVWLALVWANLHLQKQAKSWEPGHLRLVPNSRWTLTSRKQIFWHWLSE